MTQFLPPNLLALFAPRDPIPYLPPVGKLSWEKKTDGYTGVASLVKLFEHPSETPPPVKGETKDERRERKRKEKAEQMQYKLEQEIAMWNPQSAETATTDPYKTLFVARINYDTSESKLRREFEVYGPIKKIIIVHNKITGKPRGYAFIEYEHERDMHSAYKHADGKKIDSKRVLVDVERARTVKGWLPRRLGGGLGGTRKGGPEVNVRHSGRDDDRRRRSMSRDHEEPMRPRDNERRGSRDRDRERERERDRERRRRPRRSPVASDATPDVPRERERKRRRSRSKERDRDRTNVGIPEEGVEKERRRHRSRSRERKKRSRSRERKHRRDRDRDRGRDKDKVKGNDVDPVLESVKIKQEPEDDYPDYNVAPVGVPPPSMGNGDTVGLVNYPLKEEDSYQPRNGAPVKNEDGELNPPPPYSY